jgi:hypothetical protein
MTALARMLAILLIILQATTTAQAQEDDAVVVKHVSDFEITGNGSSPSWKNTEWITMAKREGDLPYGSQAKLLYSDKGVYTLFKFEDKILSATRKADFLDLWKDDVFEIFFWTDEGTPLYFEYELTPLNYELAILVPNFNGDFLGWRPWQYEGERKIRHAVKILKDEKQKISGWTGEFFIPFALLKPLRNAEAKKGTRWRVNIYRIDYDEDKKTKWAWKPVDTNFHDYQRFGTMIFD